MYVKSTRTSAKREVQKERSAKRDDQIARPRRAKNCELRAMRSVLEKRCNNCFVFIPEYHRPIFLPYVYKIKQ